MTAVPTAATDAPAETPTNALSLVADIGGTNTRIALTQNGRVLPETVRRHANAGAGSLEAVLRRYLAEAGAPRCNAACVALAGPVRDGVGSMTNLDWQIDLATLSRATGAEHCILLNDLQAQGHALDHVAAGALRPVLDPDPASPPPPGATRLVIGIGTGFNAAAVLETPAGRLVTPSEAGHAGLPVRDAQELALARFITAAPGWPAIDDVLSGRGLERIYGFLAAGSGDGPVLSAAQIVDARADPLAATALELFFRLLGRVAGDLALVHLPYGGVVLTGGVAEALAPLLSGSGFGAAFRDKGRFSDLMRQIPVAVLCDDVAALTGCAAHLAQGG